MSGRRRETENVREGEREEEKGRKEVKRKKRRKKRKAHRRLQRGKFCGLILTYEEGFPCSAARGGFSEPSCSVASVSPDPSASLL